MSLDMKSVVVAGPGQVSCDLDGETVILSVASGLYYGLDPVGTNIWNKLQSQRTVQEIRDELLREYDVDPERLERELLALLEQFAEHGLVDVEHPALR